MTPEVEIMPFAGTWYEDRPWPPVRRHIEVESMRGVYDILHAAGGICVHRAHMYSV